jgi:hypothetical protein
VIACGEEEVGEARNAPRFLEQQRGGQGVIGADESTKNPHGGTIHHGGGTIGNAVVSVGLNGEGVARGHGGGHLPRSGSSTGRLVRCGGRLRELTSGGYGGEKRTTRGLIEHKNKNNRGVRCGRCHAEARGERGPTAAWEQWR